MSSRKRTARMAGLIYLVFAIVSIVEFLYIPTFVVSGNATATANNVASSELMFRARILTGLIGQVIFIFLVLALYRLLNEVDHVQALLMVMLVVIGATATILNGFNRVAALVILDGADVLPAFEQAQLEALAYIFLRFNGQAQQIIQIFWGLWLFPFGLLVYRSRFIPKILGLLLIIAGFPYLLSSFISILFPHYMSTLSPLMMVLETGELPIIFWLLTKGARDEIKQALPAG